MLNPLQNPRIRDLHKFGGHTQAEGGISRTVTGLELFCLHMKLSSVN